MTDEYSIQKYETNKSLDSSNENLCPAVLNLFEIYTELIYTVGWANGLGMDLYEPSLNVYETLLSVKSRSDLLPKEIREKFPQPFHDLERKLANCEKEKKSLDEAITCLVRGFDNLRNKS